MRLCTRLPELVRTSRPGPARRVGQVNSLDLERNLLGPSPVNYDAAVRSRKMVNFAQDSGSCRKMPISDNVGDGCCCPRRAICHRTLGRTQLNQDMAVRDAPSPHVCNRMERARVSGSAAGVKPELSKALARLGRQFSSNFPASP